MSIAVKCPKCNMVGNCFCKFEDKLKFIENTDVIYGRNSAVVHADLKNIPIEKAEPKLTWDDIKQKFWETNDADCEEIIKWLSKNFEPPKPIKND